MRSSALRSIAKINSNVLQNSSRFFSYKFEMTPAGRFSSETTEEVHSPPGEETKPSSFRYSVRQTRSSPVERPSATGDVNFAQKQTVRAAIEQQNLQPSMLPEYYQANLDRSVLLHPEPAAEGARISSSSPRKFQVSKTCANAILPLKSVKLANPFPEPVKMMMSRTVADDEKAELMLAESKSQKNVPDWAKPNANFRSFSTDVKRWYSSVSSDPDKCKKFKTTKKETGQDCPKMKMKGCAPPARKSCDRAPVPSNCKKQEAPYASYSELCHEDPEPLCKTCPWQVQRDTNIRPQKKKFHTCTWAQLRRSGLEIEDTRTEQAQPDPNPPTDAAALEESEERLDGMLCDMRKPDCKQPNTHKCPPGTTKSEREKKRTPDRPKSKERPKKAASATLEELVERELLPIRDGAALSLKKGDKEQGERGGCKIKKFKFPPCKQVKKEDENVVEEKCPKKKKKKIIRDCPKTDDKDKKCEGAEDAVEYRLMANKKDKSECPEVDTSTDSNAIDKGRCKKENLGITKECPGDLLQKRKRKGPKNKKKASDLIPPVEPEPEKPRRPQPSLRRV